MFVSDDSSNQPGIGWNRCISSFLLQVEHGDDAAADAVGPAPGLHGPLLLHLRRAVRRQDHGPTGRVGRPPGQQQPLTGGLCGGRAAADQRPGGTLNPNS